MSCLYLLMFLDGSINCCSSPKILWYFPGSLSQLCRSLDTAPWPKPLIIANMELKFLHSLHCPERRRKKRRIINVFGKRRGTFTYLPLLWTAWWFSSSWRDCVRCTPPSQPRTFLYSRVRRIVPASEYRTWILVRRGRLCIPWALFV